ncbi:hypothetical protein [Limosilactobacillus equigenerosi]|uniref:hypothetical protein n=1 Tax=Limosilactobacillus equigenerosi TaxID=417373 RepID=UPI000704E815|nr:hypothetical protein [Limosilactobacillus equigenerosi]
MKKENVGSLLEIAEFFLGLFTIGLMIYELVVYYAYFFAWFLIGSFGLLLVILFLPLANLKLLLVGPKTKAGVRFYKITTGLIIFWILLLISGDEKMGLAGQTNIYLRWIAIMLNTIVVILSIDKIWLYTHSAAYKKTRLGDSKKEAEDNDN